MVGKRESFLKQEAKLRHWNLYAQTGQKMVAAVDADIATTLFSSCSSVAMFGNIKNGSSALLVKISLHSG